MDDIIKSCQRPKIGGGKSKSKFVIDWEQVAQLLSAGCSGDEVAATFGISAPTLYQRCVEEVVDEEGFPMAFLEFKRRSRKKGDATLRTTQYRLAVEKEDKTMLIWLGKQRLKQSEKQEIKQQSVTRVDISNVNPEDAQNVYNDLIRGENDGAK